MKVKTFRLNMAGAINAFTQKNKRPPLMTDLIGCQFQVSPDVIGTILTYEPMAKVAIVLLQVPLALETIKTAAGPQFLNAMDWV